MGDGLVMGLSPHQLLLMGYAVSPWAPIAYFPVIIMMPLAITELGTDGAITGIMKSQWKQQTGVRFGY